VKRPTIIDIARRVGVSKAAVSYALNGRYGVSSKTRERVLEVASELGWHASSAARALSKDRSGSVGIVLARPPEVLRTEPYFLQLLSGLEQTLSAHEVSLQLALVTDRDAELATYRRWWAERRVDGFVLTDLRMPDPRPALLRELGAPTVLFGARGRTPGIPGLRTAERQDVLAALEHLAARGHQRIGHVLGSWNLQHTQRRARAISRAVGDLLGTEVSQADGGYTEEGGVSATRALLAAETRPTAIVYDNDVMAVAAVAHAEDLGVRVPADLAVLAWDDSILCRVVRPPVTAFAHDIAADGTTVARMLLELIETGTTEEAEYSPRTLIPRASTG